MTRDALVHAAVGAVLLTSLAGCESLGGEEHATRRGMPAREPAAEVEAPEDEAAETTAEAEPSDAPPEIERPYEEGVDAQAQIDAAVTASAEDGKRVLLMFGANWCEWCRRLDYVFQNEPRVSSALQSDYRLVHVDIGARSSDVNRDVAARYGDPIPNGLPCLVVLNAEGEVEHVQETGSLEEGDRHDPALVLAFLGRFANRG